MEGDYQTSSQRSLSLRFPVIEVSVLPVEPGMAEFVSKDISSPGDRKLFSQIDRLELIVPNTIRVGVASVHLAIGQLAHGYPITER